MTVMQFDLTKPSADDLKKILPEVRRTQMVAMGKLLATVAVECPLEWGAPDKAETYTSKPFREVLAVAWKDLSAAREALDTELEGVEFDLSTVTPEEFDRLTKDIESSDPVKMAGVMAMFVKKCPKAWGDPSKRETFLKLKYYTQFLPVAQALTRAGLSELENFQRLLTSE